MGLLKELRFCLVIALMYIYVCNAQGLIEQVTTQNQLSISFTNCKGWRLAVETNTHKNWKTIPSECSYYVRDYMTTSKQYQKDCDLVTKLAIEYANNLEPFLDGKDVWIFDMDETSLSNIPYYTKANVRFGELPHNRTQYIEWVKEAKAPAIPGVLALYKRLQELGVKIVFLTGTHADYAEPRKQNLVNTGYESWFMMIFKDTTETTMSFKARRRTELEQMGYRIIGNIADQWRDLSGPSAGQRTFKMPNPMYYLP